VRSSLALKPGAKNCLCWASEVVEVWDQLDSNKEMIYVRRQKKRPNRWSWLLYDEEEERTKSTGVRRLMISNLYWEGAPSSTHLPTTLN
jgi:hypothetical protein